MGCGVCVCVGAVAVFLTLFRVFWQRASTSPLTPAGGRDVASCFCRLLEDMVLRAKGRCGKRHGVKRVVVESRNPELKNF